MTARVVDVEVISSEVFGAGGFVKLRRMKVRNVRQDGSRSEPYVLDAVERRAGADAVVVIAHEQGPRGPRVLLRRGLRPVGRLGRAGEPTREGTTPEVMVTEAVAGILEAEDLGDEGLRRRAALELEEEVGLKVASSSIEPMGPPIYVSVGIMAERHYYCRAEAALEPRGPIEGDGSLLEEGGAGVVLDLDEALSLCRRGEIQDAKTEVGLRRLAELLTAAVG